MAAQSQKHGRSHAAQASRRLGRPEVSVGFMSTTDDSRWGDGVNAEAISAWDGPLFDALREVPGDLHHRAGRPRQRRARAACRRSRASGCSTWAAASATRPSRSPRSWAPRARRSAWTPRRASSRSRPGRRRRPASDNASFLVADVQTEPLGGPYDMAFSRMGTMFFVSPVAALRNVRESLVPGGQARDRWSGAAARTTTGSTRPADRRGHRPEARGVRRADLRPGPVLDGERRHRHRQSCTPASRTSRCAAATSTSWAARTPTRRSRW